MNNHEMNVIHVQSNNNAKMNIVFDDGFIHIFFAISFYPHLYAGIVNVLRKLFAACTKHIHKKTR